MRTIGALGIASIGAGLIAVSYGLARFALGLFLPDIRADLGLSAEQMGLIGSLPFASFALASLFAPMVASKLGARHASVAASGFAVLGLILVSLAQGANTLGVGVFTCGIATGLMMPALAAGARAVVRPSLQGRVTAIMNAGTSIGIVLSVPAVFLLTQAWRWGYLSFAVLAAVGLLVAWLFIPSASLVPAPDRPRVITFSAARWLGMTRLLFFAFGMGLVSATYWVFAPDLVVTVGHASSAVTGWLWLTLGVAGLAGAVAGDLCDLHGSPMTQALALVAMATSIALVAASPGQVAVALASAAVFGAAYMTLTGLYLLGGIRLFAKRPSLGAVLPFLGVAIGQAVGSPLVGVAVGRLGYANAFAGFAVLALLLALASPLYPRHRSSGGRAEEEGRDPGDSHDDAPVKSA